MTAKTTLALFLGTSMLLIGTSTTAQAQELVNLTPAPTPAGPHSFKQGTDIVVAGGTQNPATNTILIETPWRQAQPIAGWYTKDNGFTTDYPPPPHGSTIQAPAYDANNPNKVCTITVRTYHPTTGLPGQSKTIEFKVTQ